MSTIAILIAASQAVAAPPPRSSYECVAIDVVAPGEERTPGGRSVREEPGGSVATTENGVTGEASRVPAATAEDQATRVTRGASAGTAGDRVTREVPDTSAGTTGGKVTRQIPGGSAATTGDSVTGKSPGAKSVASEGRIGREVPSFSAARTVDLLLQVRIRPVLTGDHLLHLKLYTPRGFLYQTMTLPFRFESALVGKSVGAPPAVLRVEGFPRPLAVQSLTGPTRRRPQGNRVTARLPVAGTSIALGSLFGGWTAVPYLDDRIAPCGPAASFVIDE